MTQKEPAAWMWTAKVERENWVHTISIPSLCEDVDEITRELVNFYRYKVSKIIGKEPLYFEEPEEGLCECEKKEKILSEFDKIL